MERRVRLKQFGACFLVAVRLLIFLLERILCIKVTHHGEQLFDIADPRSEFESEVIHKFYMEDFKSRLTEQDAKILQMRYDGNSFQEIADVVGFKTAGAVSKRILKIAGTYEDFVSDQYDKFLENHITR